MMTQQPKTVDAVLLDMARATPTSWMRASIAGRSDVGAANPQTYIGEAQMRFDRFRPVLAGLFSGQGWDGEVSSALVPWQPLASGAAAFVKCDHQLPMTGSVKARGGVHELLKYIERIAMKEGLLSRGGNHMALVSDRARDIFGHYSVSVASTGNLGYSVGVVGRAFGLKAIVHMSRDAKLWKKERLRACGSEVIEHRGDYSDACAAAREEAALSTQLHFVDDEASPDLFWGYGVAARELSRQLAELDILPTRERPVVIYLPCGVGGAPGGITCGLKHIYGDSVICIFVEPTASPCVLAALATRATADDIPSVYAFGLDNRTVADGLAVPTASAMMLSAVGGAVDAAVTVTDDEMIAMVKTAWRLGGLRLEPSAAAGLAAMERVASAASSMRHWPDLSHAKHIAWATGGSLLPDSEWLPLINGGSSSQDPVSSL